MRKRVFLRRVFLHNLPLKVMSLMLAAGLWYAVSREPVSEVVVSVPVQFHNVPENLEIGFEHIPQVEIRVRGPARVVRDLKPSEVRAEVDLGGARPGEWTFDLKREQVHALPELSVVQIVPSQLHLNLDVPETREVGIRARVMGSFAQGLQVARAETEPSRITVSGPKRHVDALEEALTDPVDASGTMRRGTFMTHVYLSDPLVQVVNPAPVQVTVIMERIPERTSERSSERAAPPLSGVPEPHR
jgi:YbbR domain-containing protein